MTTDEQFSPEYIRFLQSDEAKALQGLWKPRIGDWAYGSGVVHLRYKIDRDGSYFATESGESTFLGQLHWLPTLQQLLQIIERAGWDWSRLDDGTWRIHKPGYGTHEEWHLPDMLAAAKLAVRALEASTQAERR